MASIALIPEEAATGKIKDIDVLDVSLDMVNPYQWRALWQCRPGRFRKLVRSYR